AARGTVEQKYALDVCVPRVRKFFEEVAASPRSPSVRADLLVREVPALALVPSAAAGGDQAADGREGGALAPFDGALPFRVGGTAAQESTSARRLGFPRAGPRFVQPRTILFAWEVGAGLGHVMQMRPLVEDLARDGHCVVMALRHLHRAVEAFGDAGVFYLQAPYRPTGPAHFARAVGFAQVL